MDMEWLSLRRLSELEKVVSLIQHHLPNAKYVLEIGAGSGIQSKKLHEIGFEVKAIDVQESAHKKYWVWPVKEYNGTMIPYPDETFDVVFSSSVLEHIPHLDEFENEIKRVLKPSGVVIHVLPSSTWRFWTYWTHYLFIVKTAVKLLHKKLFSADQNRDLDDVTGRSTSIPKHRVFRNILFASLHGEHGNVLSELILFNRYVWQYHFSKHHFYILQITTNELFYTGYASLGSLLNLSIRKKLSRFLGASHNIFVLKK
jgi:ubiquinone/menaquinone biosynthesis C-methylase UbiE